MTQHVLCISNGRGHVMVAMKMRWYLLTKVRKIEDFLKDSLIFLVNLYFTVIFVVFDI